MFVGIRNFKRFGSTAQSGCAGGSADLQKRSSVESRHIVNLLCSKANLTKTDFSVMLCCFVYDDALIVPRFPIVVSLVETDE